MNLAETSLSAGQVDMSEQDALIRPHWQAMEWPKHRAELETDATSANVSHKYTP